ncbi:MAG: RDD family protein [Pseudomonadales bacterium]|nr:RDD family protein [Pseudomonadales bacterium]MCP5184478.1 RDD family protein [Pseudomonadales bacterium]
MTDATARDVLTVPSVTGVDVELRIAGPGARSYAFVIDWHVRFLAAAVWFLAALLVALALGMNDRQQVMVYMGGLPAAIIYFFYHPVIELVTGGSTPGKRRAGIRIVSVDGSNPTAGALLIRNALRLIDSMPVLYLVGFAATLLTRHAVRIGDLAAGTLLVYEAVEGPPVADLPAAAVARLGLENVELVQDVLGRWDELPAHLRTSLARRLLTKLGDDDLSLVNDEQLYARLSLLLKT